MKGPKADTLFYSDQTLSCIVSNESSQITLKLAVSNKFEGAANRFPDKCDQDPNGARAVNVEATKYLLQSCASHSAFCIYISTDYVFPGRPGEAPYSAGATPQPTNTYGVSIMHQS